MKSTIIVFLAVLAAVCPAPAQEDGEPEDPRDLGLEERTGARLSQFEISVTGDPELVRSLRPEDFKVKIGLQKLPDYRLDRFCDDPGETGRARSVAAPVAAPQPAYLFYFDQPHLTLSGRARAIELARPLIRRLAGQGGRVTIVSNANRVVTFADLTSDTGVLLEAVDRLEADPMHWDTYATEEISRLDEIMRKLNEASDVSQATAVARRYQRYERWLTERSLRRFEMVLGRLAHLDPPKAVLYFADTVRANPGEHYLRIFSESLIENEASLAGMDMDAFSGRIAFDRVIEQSSAHGIRLYPIFAQGLVQQTGFRHLALEGASSGGNLLRLPMTRIRHAQDSMASMASETGGEAFLHGAKASKIADRILADLSCILLFSFDPGEFPRDTPLRLKVESNRPGLKLHSRGQIVIQSAAARTTSRLLGAFTMPGARAAELPLGIGVYPIEYREGKLRALLQIHAPAVETVRAEWDVGASLSDAEGVLDEVSARVSLARAGSPVILEREIDLPPGGTQIVSVAHETMTNRVTSTRTAVQWNSPGRKEARLGPVALLQPSAGVFVRDGEVRTWGSLAVDSGETVRGDRPIALVGIVCTGEKITSPLQVRRRLIGEEASELPAVDLQPAGKDCVQVRDVVPAGSLRPGLYRYEMRLLREGEEIDDATREFVLSESL